MIQDKTLLKAISILIHTSAQADCEITKEEALIINEIMINTFKYTKEEAKAIYDECHSANLLEMVENSLVTIKKENNQILNLTVLALVTSIVASDGVITGGENAIYITIKEALL